MPLVREMSLDEYLAFPRRPGWKYEYVDGKLHAASAEVVVPFVLELDKLRAPAAADLGTVELRRLEERDDGPLVDLFVDAFLGTMEYLGVGEDDIRASAVESLARNEHHRRGARHELSWVAEDGGGLVGAALFRHGRDGVPLLDLVFTAPDRRRQGLASALLQRAAEAFREAGVERVHSSVMLGNEPSYAWHRRAGFEEIPYYLVASHRAAFYRHELHRLKELGRTDEELAELREQAGHWAAERQRLDELAAVEPRLAFPNIY